METSDIEICDGDESEECDPEIPSLVAALVISSIADVRLLKTCRLVCKSWNASACAALRTASYVLVNEEKTNMEELNDILCNSSSGPLSYLPSPFQNFHVVATSFSKSMFTNLISFESVKVTHFGLVPGTRPLDEKNFAAFLKSINMTVTDMFIETSASENMDDEVLRGSSPLTLLKHLKIKDQCSLGQCRHVDFMKNVLLRTSRLESFMMEVKAPELFLYCLLTPQVCERVQELEIVTQEIPSDTWRFLGACPLRRLKSLVLDYMDYTMTGSSEVLERNLAPLIQNVAPLIECLFINYLRVKMLPICPRLQVLTLSPFEGHLGGISPSKFPYLKAVHLYIRGDVSQYLENHFDPHGGIETVSVTLYDDLDTDNLFPGETPPETVDMHLHVFTAYLAIQFPRVTDFELITEGTSSLNTSKFFAIHKAFPKLKTLRLNGPSEFPAFAGTQMSIVRKYLEAGWLIESIPRTASIFSFEELEELVLGPYFHMTNDIIANCVSKISTLRTLKFSWNSSLSVPAVRSGLCHLEAVEITGGPEEKSNGVLQELEGTMSNCKIDYEDEPVE